MSIARGKRDDSTAAPLAERFPQCFAIYEARQRPLKIGIHADITGPLGGAITWRELHNALCSYILIRGYLLNLRAGAERIDLDRNVAGVAIADEADHARAVLMRRRAKKAARAATAPVPSPQQPTSPQADGAATQATDSISRGHYC
jgi:sRNA-binding protein